MAPSTPSHPALETSAEHSIWIRATVFRPVAVLMLFVGILVVGIVVFPRMRTELLPGGLSTGSCGVYIPLRDGTPREVMDNIAKPCEDLLRTLPGLRSIISSSGSRRCFIRLEFDPKYDMSVMVAEVKDRIDRAKVSWPESADRYHIWRHRDSDLPAYIVSLGIDVNEDEVDLDYIFDEIIRKRVERLPGVARAHIWGILEKRVEIQLQRDRLRAYGIDLRGLVERLALDNSAITAGRVRDGEREYMVRVEGRFGSFQEVLDYPVNAEFRIRDFANVDYATAVRDRLSRVNGELSRVVVIFKESGANAVEVCERVEKEIAGLEKTLRRRIRRVGRVESHAWLNQGKMIEGSVDSLIQSGLFGGLCAVTILFLFFRRVSLTLLVTLAIPFSLLITVVWLYFSGGSFNLLTLMGLSLGIGMLVDNSIVVVENTLRHGERGLPPRAAAIGGVTEVGLAVALATLTTIMVLLPIFFLSDPRFKTMTQTIGLPLCVSVLASLLVALVFIPQGAIHIQGSLWRRGGPPTSTAERFSRVNHISRRVLEWCLRRRLEAVLIATGLLLTTSVAFDSLVKVDLELDGPRGVELRLELPKNFTLREANDTFSVVENAVRKIGEEKGLGIESITAWFDSQGGDMRVFFRPGMRMSEREFFQTIRPDLPRLPGVKYHLGYESFSRNQGQERIRVYIEANDCDRLEEAEAMVHELLEDKKRFPWLGEISRWSEDEREEVRIEVQRRAAQHAGVDTATVSRMVAWALRGAPLPDFVVQDREYPFWILYDDAEKEDVRELNSILVHRPGGPPVRLENLASYSFAPGSGDIHRRNGKLTSGLSAGIEGEADPVPRFELEHALRRLPLPEGCEASTRGKKGSFEEDMKNSLMALGMALALVFFVMGLLFESWLLPLSVLFCVPFAFFGSTWSLLITGVPLDAVGMIGMLMLAGIVVNNAIVLVDYVNRLRSRGMGRRNAILRGVQVRFRPIWMTALTTIFGLLPLALLEPQAEGVDYRALAVVLIGGLGTSTFFTIFVVPLLYTLLDDVQRMARALLRP